MKGHNASLAGKSVTLPSDQSWVKVLDDNTDRMYLLIQNDQSNKAITFGCSHNETAPTAGMNLDGSNTLGDLNATFEFKIAPTNAVWAKTTGTVAHTITVVYDD